MLDPVNIITTLGLIGIFLIVFAESGLLIGFFFPGDTLLFAAGIFASRGFFSISLLIIGCSVAAIVGDSVGYWMGKKMGRKLFEMKDSVLFSQKKLNYARDFYNKHGSKTIVLARFVPIVRTFAPVIAGVASMNYKKFLSYNIIGGILWSVVVPLLGYYFGALIPNIDKILFPVLIAVIIISFIPVIWKIVRYYFIKIKQ